MTRNDEAARQQALLGAIFHHRAGDELPPLLAGSAARVARGLSAYRASAQVAAERALSAAYPTVLQLLGDEAFAGLARQCLYQHPPQRGDWARYGELLPALIADAEALAGEPYLADVARLDWAVHAVAAAADAGDGVTGLERLADTDPARLAVRFVPGSACVVSAHPVVAIWQAHQLAGDEREAAFAAVRATRAAGQGEASWVWRSGWRAAVVALPAPQAAFNRALLGGASLGAALDATQHTDTFSFEDWLTTALQAGWLAGIHLLEEPSP